MSAREMRDRGWDVESVESESRGFDLRYYPDSIRVLTAPGAATSLLDWDYVTDDVGKATVLTIGTVVCVAASMAGDSGCSR